MVLVLEYGLRSVLRDVTGMSLQFGTTVRAATGYEQRAGLPTSHHHRLADCRSLGRLNLFGSRWQTRHREVLRAVWCTKHQDAAGTMWPAGAKGTN